jgi:hypothetical protein
MPILAVTNLLPGHLDGLHTAGIDRLPGPPGVAVRLYVALFRTKLDCALARGADPVSRRALAVRAGQLASARGRARVVGALERAFADARAPRVVTSAVAPDATAIRLNRSALLDLVDRLRAPEPVAAAGVARLLVVLRDGCSPLYLPARPDLLAAELDQVQRVLAP